MLRHCNIHKMAFSEEDKHAIKFLRETKHYGAKRFLKEFPHKGWTIGGLNKLIKKIDSTGSVQRRLGSGRRRTVRTPDNVSTVEELILSQEGKPQTHRSQRQIAHEVGISLKSVNRIVKNDLALKCLKRSKAQQLSERDMQTRLERCRQLLRRYPASIVNFIWFTDEKLFTVASPSNSQNSRLYTTSATRKKDIASNRLLRTCSTFSTSVMVSVGVSGLGRTSIHFVEPGVKIDGQYYREVLLLQNLLPEMHEISEFFIFQQDSAPAHRAHQTIAFLEKETPDFLPPTLWPPNSPDLNPVDYKIWGCLQELVYRTKVRDVDDLASALCTLGIS